MTSNISLILMMLMIFVSNADDSILSLHRRHFGHATQDKDNIETCLSISVEPGDDFHIQCKSKYAVLIKVNFCR